MNFTGLTDQGLNGYENEFNDRDSDSGAPDHPLALILC